MPFSTLPWTILPPWTLPDNLDTVTRLAELPNPSLLPGLDAAVESLIRAVPDKRILIYSDYDCDGCTAAAILYLVLVKLGANVRVYSPDRIRDGYGLRADAVPEDVDVVVTVDNGVSKAGEVAKLHVRGIEVIVTDHHPMHGPLPECVVVHPGLPDAPENAAGIGVSGSPSPLSSLCGAGVAWFLAYGIAKSLGRRDLQLARLLQLAVIGTVADVVPLIGVNRFIVAEGLRQMSAAPLPGIASLLEVCRLSGVLKSSHIAFQIAPRMNAAGRLTSMYDAWRLLVSDTPDATLADTLHSLNLERRKLTEEAVKQSVCSNVNFSGEWLPGIVGVIAGRLTEKRHLPQVVVSVHGGKGHGSCRAPAGFHIVRALDQCKDLLLGYGGHAQAAGLGILPENLEEFRERFDAIVAGADIPAPSLTLHDLPIAQATEGLIGAVAAGEPYGQGNPEPMFYSGRVRVVSQASMSEGKHLRHRVQSGGVSQNAVWFNCGQVTLPEYVELAYHPAINEWNGRRNVQLMVEGVRIPT